MNAAKKSVFLLLSLALCGAVGARAQGVDFKVVSPAGYKPLGLPFSPGILAGNTLYVSGQGAADANGNLPASFEDQVKQELRNVRAVLQGAGMDYNNVTWMNVYLASAADIDAMNQAYWQEIGNDPPARSVLVVGSLPGRGRVEINCIAVKSSERRRAIWPKGWRHEKDMDPPAIEAGDVLYISAQNGADPKTGQIPSSFTDETRQALENVSAVTKAAGMSMKNVLFVNPYMSVGGQYDAMGSVYKSFFEFGNTPGRATIQMAALPDGQHIVFSAIAGADLAKRKAIRPRNMPPSPTASPAILYGDTLYLSAKDGFIPGQGIVTPDLQLQLRQSMRNLLDGLEEANMTFSDVVFSTVYLRAIGDYTPMNDLYKTFFGPVPPARTTLQENNDSSAEAAEQISFIAVRNKNPQKKDQQ
ncbi:MAG TPA: RidA family protein [Acidobacteriaceae bacterium]|jgi:enamine deaminase RidA (YjgF/YER057c/UK114 family)